MVYACCAHTKVTREHSDRCSVQGARCNLDCIFFIQQPLFGNTDTHLNAQSRHVCIFSFVRVWPPLKQQSVFPVCVYSQFLPTCESALSYVYTLWSNNAINDVLNTVRVVLIPTVLMAEKCIRNYLDHPLYYQWLCVGLQKHAKNSFFIQSSMKAIHIYIHDGIKVYILWVSIWHTIRF